jgi:hypothetical protein
MGDYPLMTSNDIGDCLIAGGLVYNIDMAKKQFKPFTHDDLELKNGLIEYARSIKDKKEIETRLASAMIYSNFAEYMAGHLLENLRHLMYQSTHRDFAGILFIDQRNKKDKTPTLGVIIDLLRQFGFPDKDDVLELLSDIGCSRNNLFHNFAKSDVKGFEILGADIDIINEKTEELFIKINTIYAGLQKILINPAATSIEDKDEQKTI